MVTLGVGSKDPTETVETPLFLYDRFDKSMIPYISTGIYHYIDIDIILILLYNALID